jgi:6-phospho-3-hexuloisomerase
MSFVKEVANWILSGIKGVIQVTDEDQIERMIEMVLDAEDKKILILGSGRSGFVGRAFALRLMHLGFSVYVSGETITPALSPDDLVIAISGSGRTKTIVAQTEVSKEIGAKVIAVTSHDDSTICQYADLVVQIKGRSKDEADIDYERRQITGEHDNAPLGTMFELSAMVFFDSVIADLMQRLGKTEIDLKRKHANAE